ncbi:MAG TPA: hypothetical protein VKG45_06190 [Actinomycetes bacterium]|nr:hypothetical protein [Actinomycetes bacterium]
MSFQASLVLAEDQGRTVAQDGAFEGAMSAGEAAAAAALQRAGALTRELKRVKAAAASGQTRELRRGLEAVVGLADQVAGEARALRSGYDFDEQAHLASGAYTKELLAAAAAAGVDVFEDDDRLLCYPSLVRLLPDQGALEIDRKRERRLRPSFVVGLLAAAQRRGPRFRPEPFLDSLRTAYELVVARDGKRPDAVVRLIDVWGVLTVLPGQSREYSKQEFARDLYLLDQSGLTKTPRSPRELRWSASTGTKGAGVLTTVTRGGQQRRYWGIGFSRPAGAAGS